MAAAVLHRVPLSASDQRVVPSVGGGKVVLRATAAGTTEITAAPGLFAQRLRAWRGRIFCGFRDA